MSAIPTAEVDSQRSWRSPAAVPDYVPTDDFSQSVYQHALAQLDPTIFAHSLRVYIYAEAFSRMDLSSLRNFQPTAGPEIFSTSDEQTIDKSLLFVASMFHDAGTCAVHDHDQRFEVCGADAAVAFMESHGKTDRLAQRSVWEAIALHTSPGIAERMSLMTRVMRMGPKTDFGTEQYRILLGQEFIDATEALLPRGEIEKVLGDGVAVQAERREGEERNAKAPAVSWPWNLLRCKLDEPEWQGVNKGF